MILNKTLANPSMGVADAGFIYCINTTMMKVNVTGVEKELETAVRDNKYVDL